VGEAEIVMQRSGKAGFFQRIRAMVLRQEYLPSAILGVLINPYYIIRRRLLHLIIANRDHVGGTVLDFGCGSKPYESLFTAEKYVGVDISLSDSDYAGSCADYFYDGKTLPFENEAFDTIFTTEVFEHVFNLDEIVTELARVLKQDGKLIVTTPFVWVEHLVPYDFARYTSFGIRHILEKHGFEIIVLEKSSTYVETIFQMWNAYIWQNVAKGKGVWGVFVQLFVIAPTTVVGIVLEHLLPKSRDLFSSTLTVAKKVGRPVAASK
jgi:SAM-dependent methyltransferase